MIGFPKKKKIKILEYIQNLDENMYTSTLASSLFSICHIYVWLVNVFHPL